MPDKYIGKVVLVKLPGNKRLRYRWIIDRRPDGRYVARAPKIHVLIKHLRLHRDNDYNAPHILPEHTDFFDQSTRKRRRPLVKKFRHTQKHRSN